MPKVVITFDPDQNEYYVDPAIGGVEYDPEYQVLMDMKASHFRNIRRNEIRYQKDKNTLLHFFVEAQQSGRVRRER